MSPAHLPHSANLALASSDAAPQTTACGKAPSTSANAATYCEPQAEPAAGRELVGRGRPAAKASRREPGRDGLGDSPARQEARWRTHLHIVRARKAARAWPSWRSMPPSRRNALFALLAEADRRGWDEVECSERYLVTVVIRHRHRRPSAGGHLPPPPSHATCHRVLRDLREAGWLKLAREGCKAARVARRWRIALPPMQSARTRAGAASTRRPVSLRPHQDDSPQDAGPPVSAPAGQRASPGTATSGQPTARADKVAAGLTASVVRPSLTMTW